MKIFTVYDSKADAYMTPFFTMTAGLAVRSFQEASIQEGHQFNKHAADYTLYEIGDYNEQKGIITMHKAHIDLGTAKHFEAETNIVAVR